MEPAFVFTVFAFFVVAFYLLLSKHTVRILLGVAILGNAVNLLIFTAGRIVRERPPIVADGEVYPSDGVANALPQALILTAIVISFSFFAFLLVLVYRAYQDLGTDDTDAMRLAEPDGQSAPPLGY